jgi:hypothetical protein
MPVRNPQWSISAMARSLAASRAYSDQTQRALSFEQIEKSGFTPHTRVMAHIRANPRILLGREPYGRATSTKSKFATKGRTNGMPWDGTSPINESTHVEIVPAHKPVKGLEALIVRLWALPGPGERNAALWALSDELRPYSAEISEDVRMLCGMILQGIGQ